MKNPTGSYVRTSSGNELIPDVTGHSDKTLHKVYEALQDAGIENRQAMDVVDQMQNKGILFHERLT